MGNLAFANTSDNKTNIIMDLSRASNNDIEAILLRMSAKDLLISCALVSHQWHHILSAKSFWKDWAEMRNYHPPWHKFFSTLDIHSIRQVVVRRPFGRNFVHDAWDMSKLGTAQCFVADSRWEINSEIVWTDDNSGHKPRIEIPPCFFDGQQKTWRTEDGIEEPVNECVAISYGSLRKRIEIKLADEGLTDEILDNFTPPIVVSELVANRKDCASTYRIRSNIHKGLQQMIITDAKLLRAETEKRFDQWEEEGWHKIEHVFSEYPKGVRFLVVECLGHDSQFWAGNYGPKIAKFSVTALPVKSTK
ncbi:hypothetical protein niasHT_002108 [Heterodera trifolii]|uniref:FBA domain-containing protein n=1 Tax=Heterodera trifolii TaxID=157864 RepID=A0ABD2MF87_9BILA